LFLTDTTSNGTYILSLHDALPIWIDYEKFDWSENWEERLKNPSTDEDYEQIKWLSDEIERLYDGDWIYIAGELVYLNRYMYFFLDRKSTRLNSSHVKISYAVFCLK